MKPLHVGSTLGPYEILEPLGTGGMGEVFKARDTRLDRLVAIKVAREEFSERFQREARLVASLNHPHICTLYDIGPNYLVMEFVEGRPVKGPLPVKEALRYASQIASALDHAHRKGVIHRDLKPDNILVTKSGIKLLDFGLAKRFGPDDPTITVAGSVMGTPAYMAPEQWKGKDADARTDIFAFGCLLYEVVTGRSARLGIQRVHPAELDWVIKHCLEEEPDDRWQSAVDLRAELEHLRDEKVRPASTRFTRRLPEILTAVAGLAAIIFGLLWLTSVRNRTDPEVVRFPIYAPDRTSFTNTVVVSPNGRRIAFTADSIDGKRLLWVRDLDSLNAFPLENTDGAYFPFWAPDNRHIGFFAGTKLKKVEVSGAPPQVIAGAPNGVGGTWSREGIIVFAPNSNGGFYQVPAGGGRPVPLTTPDASLRELAHRRPQFLPDGRRFLFYVSRDQPEIGGIYLGSLDSKEKELILPEVLSATYTQPGFLLFVRDRTLMGQRFNPNRGGLEGEAFPVVQGVSTFRSYAASDNGVLVYRSGEAGSRGRLTWYDRTGKELGAGGPPVFSRYPSLSPNDKRVAVARQEPQIDSADIWLVESERQVNSRFTFHPATENGPVWSPDGSRIVFTSTRDGPGDLYLKSATGGGGTEEPLLKSSDYKVATDWSRDGRFILFQLSGTPEGGIWILPMNGGKPFPYIQTPFGEAEAQFSPEAGGPHWVAYASDEGGIYEIYVASFSGVPGASANAVKWQISDGGGRQPRWRRDGRELYYIAGNGNLMAVSVTTQPKFEASRPSVLFQTHITTEPFPAFHYAVTGDGNRFLIDTAVGGPSTNPLTVVLNWTAALNH